MSGPESAAYVRACALSELADGEPLAVELKDEPVAIVRTEGQVFAIRDVCSHAEVPLSEGEVDGCTIECWLHGSRFDLRTGEPTGLPATEPVPIYPVEIRDGFVFVSLTSSNGVTP
jgi:3-phenylpropionate/trans-cinnamate dioxygenase ferredoxin component